MTSKIPKKEIITGRDARLSSPDLSKSLKQGILDSGCNICDIGIVPTPLLYFATNYLESNSGVIGEDERTGELSCIDFNEIRGDKGLDVNSKWFLDLVDRIEK